MEPADELMKAYTVVFEHLAHLGPGDRATTRQVLERLRSYLPSESRVADFGCGVGASTLVLAQCLPHARVLALDSHAPFIARLDTAANARGLGERVSAVVGDMADPPPLDGVIGEFDLIWSESAIYSVGRAKALACWRPLMKAQSWLVFSDIVWQSEPSARSDMASAFWASEYPDLTTIDNVIDELIANGFDPLDPVLSDRRAWSNYYEPLRDRLRLLRKQSGCTPALISVIAELEREIDVYDRAGNDVALCYFLARRRSLNDN